MTAVIGTWGFSRIPVERCLDHLRNDKHGVAAAVVDAIRVVEADPTVQTVGVYSFPNADGVLQLDAAIVEVAPGRHRCGAVLALEGYEGAIEGAFTVMERCPHRILVGEGAKQFLMQEKLMPSSDPLPMAAAASSSSAKPLDPSKDHDTVGIIACRDGVLTVGCSTSGKRHKLPGRVGDSPIFGSGLYAEGGVGGAVCTGDGDKICSFPLAFSVVSLMRSGYTAQAACEHAIQYFLSLPQGDSSVEVAVVALSAAGEPGAACSPNYLKEFQFCFGCTADGGEVRQFVCEPSMDA